MPASSKYPRQVKVGSAVVKIYRLEHKCRGEVFQVVWRGADGKRMKPQFTDEAAAEKEARLQASKIASGQAKAAEMTASDRSELLAIRRVCGSIPALVAVQEWSHAREITGAQILSAARAWAAASGHKFTPILVSQCVEKFIAAKSSVGKDAERTYGSKLKPIKEFFQGRQLHTISTPEWTAYLANWKDGVTRNDFRKRATTLCLWAQKQGFLPRGVALELSMTERADEAASQVGIVQPETYGRLLRYLRHYHPHYLAAAVLAGFAGVRSDEIHGKRRDGRAKRQLWEDLHLEGDEPLATVSVAKRNTPSWRTTPLCTAAVEWLSLCPPPHSGPVCAAAAMERVRDIAITSGLKLPENGFRHSYISYQVVLTGNKHQVATWAGNSVEKIDRNYRRPVLAETGELVDCSRPKPVTKSLAKSWFEMSPALAEALPHLPPPPPELLSSGRLSRVRAAVP